jgi:hypothetical protein
MKSGFIVMTFLVYFGLYTFLCGIILYFCTFFIQIIQTAHGKSRALYVYHSTQKRFIDDCCCSLDIHIESNSIKLICAHNLIIWKVHNCSLIRKEYYQEGKILKKTTLYFCTVADHFIPFVHKGNIRYFYTGFTIDFFSSPFTIAAIVPKGQPSETT